MFASGSPADLKFNLRAILKPDCRRNVPLEVAVSYLFLIAALQMPRSRLSRHGRMSATAGFQIVTKDF